MIRRLLLLAIAVVLFAFPAAAAQAATRGDVAIHVEGTFGQARGDVLPVTADVTVVGALDGKVDQALGLARSVARGTVTWTGGQIDNLFTGAGGPVRATLFCAFDATGGRCLLLGGVLGLGTVTVIALDPQPGGRLVVDVDFPSAICLVCQATR